MHKKGRFLELPEVPVAQIKNMVQALMHVHAEVLYPQHEGALSIESVIGNVVEYYESVISCMPGNIYWVDKHCVALGCNKNVLDTFGLTNLSEFKGLSFEEMAQVTGFPLETILSFKKDTLEVLNSCKAKLNVEDPPIRDSHGREVYFLTSRVPLFDRHGAILGVAGISIDITERKKMEVALLEAKKAAEAANHAKTEFLENMRHDIRTPLCGITGFAELLKLEEDRNKIKEYADLLLKSGTSLLHFLNGILDSTNIATGEIPIAKKRFDLREILAKVIDLHRAVAAHKKLDMNFYFDEAIPKHLIGDPMRVYRIVLELLANALKFTAKGQVDVYVDLMKKEEGTRLHIIKILIEDTGIGIAEHQQQELFIRFKRLTPSYKGIYKGTGLGLSIAKQFLDDLAAEIYVESTLSKGSRFTCVFEFREALFNDDLDTLKDALSTSLENHAVLKDTEVATTEKLPDSSVQKALCILLVEDDSIAAMVARAILENLGCAADLAVDGTSAIELSKNKDYHLIFMDIGLPGIDGYETTSQIRAIEAEKAAQSTSGKAHRAFIAGLTAHADPDKKQHGLDVGMNVVLMKPLSFDKAIMLFEMSV